MTDAIHHVDAVAPIEQDADGALETRLGLDEHLTTGAARAHGLGSEVAVGLAGSDGDLFYGGIGILSASSEDGRPLGTRRWAARPSDTP